jgi:predicted phage tail protein
MSDAGQFLGTVVGGIIGFVVGGPAGAVKGAALGYSVTAPKESPTYSFGTQYNTASQTIPVPVVYGRNRVAGNTIFKKVSGENNENMALQVAVSEGPIQSITAIKANDVDITSKCRIKLGERTQTADAINDQGQAFPYTAYISVELTADEDISGNPTITSIVEGRKVEVWDGSQWVVQYSQNPAYCLLDFLTNRRYGLGISKDDIDLDSFIEVANYCDELVEGEPRFQLDYVVDYQKSSLDHIQDILATFRGFLIYSAGEFRLKVDGPEEPVQAFTMNNIVADSFQYWKTSRKERYNRVVVEYTDPDEHWEKIGAQYSLDTDIQKRGLVEETFPLLGINRFSQAGRMAKFFQKKPWYCPTYCQFKVGIDSLHCEAGDVVKVSHDVPGWTEKLVRIIEVREDENDEMQLTCQEYNVAVYSDSGVVQQVKKDSELPNPFEKPASVIALTAIEGFKMLGDGTYAPQIVLTWSRPNELYWQAGNIYISSDKINWDFIGRAEDKKYIIDDVAPGDYWIKVISENREGLKEDFVTAAETTITVNGKTNPPDPPTFSSYEGIINGIFVKMNKSSELDWDGFELHVSATSGFTPDSTTLVDAGKKHTFVINNLTGGLTYYIKAKVYDRSGNVSNTSAEISIEAKKKIAEGEITGTEIADDSIDTPKLKANSITAEKIKAGEISYTKLNIKSINGSGISSTLAQGDYISITISHDELNELVSLPYVKVWKDGDSEPPDDDFYAPDTRNWNPPNDSNFSVAVRTRQVDSFILFIYNTGYATSTKFRYKWKRQSIT